MAQEASPTHLAQSIMAKKPRLGELLRLTAVPFWFDADLVDALRAKHDGQSDNVLALLDQFSFVHTGYGRYWYSGDMRQSLLELWSGDPDGLYTAHRRALACFQRRLADSPPGDLALRDELAAAHLYHLLAVDQQAGIQRLLELFEEASEEHRLAAAQKYVRVAEEHGAALSAEARAYVDYLWGRLLQLQQRWPESRAHLERLLERGELPPLVRAHVQRSLADALVPLGKAADAIPVYEQALAEFQQAERPREAGLTMAALGNAHLNLALGVWGSGWIRRPPSRSWRRAVLGVGHFLVRIPLVLYLLWRLGFRTLLPVIHRVGGGMDWIVARVLVTASNWFRSAGEALEDAGADAGLVDVHEGLAQLYRLLNYPQRAEALNHEILAMDTIREGGYRAARARLGIAHSLLLQGKAGEAAEILDELLPVFRRFGHRRRVAQTLTLRAEAARLLHQPDEAISFHRQALDEWQAADDLAAATDTLHAMEAVREQWTISVENRDAIEEAGQRLTRRHYRVRYFHPLLVAFSRVALVGLVVLFFFTVRLALRSEYGTQVDAVAVLAQPAQPELPADEGPIMAPQDEVRAPELPAIDQQFVPSPPVRAAGLVVAASFVGYLLFYALVGWLVIATTPLAEIEPGEIRAVLIGPEGIRLLTPAGSGDPLPWNDVSVLLRSDRIVVRRPLQMLSFFALFGGATPISISGRTRHYQALQQLARARAEKGTDNKVHIYNLGFDLLHSKSGWLFLVSLVYVLAFFLLAIVKPDLVTRNYDPIPYNAVDLYGLAYLGLALPLAWWFAVQPLRAQWLVSVRTPIVWLVGAAGLGLALISLLQTYRWHLPLGRPDIVTAVLAILLVGVAASHILRARIPSVSGDDKAHAYPRPVRAAVALVASVTLLAMLFAIGWEMSNFHYVAVGNSHLRAAEDYRRNGFQARAEEAYSQALEAYDRALWIRPEAYVHNSQGAVLTRLGRYSDAIYAYNRAQVLDPDEPAYVINQVLVYTSQASAPGVQRIDITLHGLAIHYLTPMIQKLAAEPGRYREQLPTARLLRAGAYYDRGQIYLDQSKEEQAAGDETAAAESHAAAMADFQRALDDYDRVARDGNASTRYRAAGYSGRGWARLKLREGVEAGDVARQQDYLQLAVGDFEQALRRSSREISAMIGLGWAHFYYSQTYPACTRGEGDPAEAVSYQDHLLAARDAYNLVVDQEKAAIHYRVRAQFEYLLRYCDGVSLREQYELTRANYDQALALYEERAVTQDELPASWYNIRGNLSYVLAGIYTDTQKVRETRDRAIEDYRRAAQIQPQDLGWWYDLAWVGYEWRNSGYWDASVEGFLGIVDRGPNQYETAAYGRLGWLAYLYQQDYVNSLQYSARALELDRDQSAVHFNEGLVYVVLGEVEAAAQSYLNGIEAADRVGQGRATRYNNAIYDLNTIQADPEGAAGRFAALLEAAKQQQACTLVGEAAPGLLVRAQPHPFPLAEPPVDLLWASDAFFPAARDAGGHWLYGVVKGQEVSGWIPASPAALSCSLDLSVLPVAEPGHLQP